MCGNIFEDRIVQLYLNVHRRFGRDLVRSSGYTMIFMLVYAESFESIGMLAYRASFCYAVDLKFVQMLAYMCFHRVSYNMGAC